MEPGDSETSSGDSGISTFQTKLCAEEDSQNPVVACSRCDGGSRIFKEEEAGK